MGLELWHKIDWESEFGQNLVCEMEFIPHLPTFSTLQTV